MHKAKEELTRQLDKCQLVVEIRDARVSDQSLLNILSCSTGLTPMNLLDLNTYLRTLYFTLLSLWTTLTVDSFFICQSRF